MGSTSRFVLAVAALAALAALTGASEDPTGSLDGVQDLSKLLSSVIR